MNNEMIGGLFLLIISIGILAGEKSFFKILGTGFGILVMIILGFFAWSIVLNSK